MRPRLIVQIAADADVPLAARCLDAQGRLTGAGPEDDPAALARSRRVYALAPGTAVLTTRVAMPVRSRQRMAQAVPWAMEDQLSEDVEALHFLLGERNAAGEVHVAVVAARTLQAWEERLARTGIHAEQIYPDYLALPRHEHAWTILVAGDRALVRTGVQTGFACESDVLALFLEAALSEAGDDAPPRLVAYLTPGATLPLPEVAPEAERHTVTDVPALLAENLDTRHAIGLRPVDTGGTGRWRRRWRVWRTAAILLAVVMLADTARGWLAQWHLEQTIAAREADIASIFTEAFPDAGTPVYPRRQMESRLAALRGGGSAAAGLLPLLTRVAPVMGPVRLTGLTWGEGGAELAVQTAELAGVDALERRLADAGLTVEVRNVTREADGVSGRLHVETGS
ncbi:type II secretion system protein GspL [Arhodomonas aquaeolei]|uniref:type II secretion system protein GspL n=1 Tax=Arhodomonas aquaeolei TaxID=2369 RepID=UPI00035D4907|nr:type II secretion system protein GspL [Arhodomonas aquaeolei]